MIAKKQVPRERKNAAGFIGAIKTLIHQGLIEWRKHQDVVRATLTLELTELGDKASSCARTEPKILTAWFGVGI